MTTPKQLKETVARLQRKGVDIAIGWAYGRPRCTTKLWLDGYETALDGMGGAR